MKQPRLLREDADADMMLHAYDERIWLRYASGRCYARCAVKMLMLLMLMPVWAAATIRHDPLLLFFTRHGAAFTLVADISSMMRCLRRCRHVVDCFDEPPCAAAADAKKRQRRRQLRRLFYCHALLFLMPLPCRCRHYIIDAADAADDAVDADGIRHLRRHWLRRYYAMPLSRFLIFSPLLMSADAFMPPFDDYCWASPPITLDAPLFSLICHTDTRYIIFAAYCRRLMPLFATPPFCLRYAATRLML